MVSLLETLWPETFWPETFWGGFIGYTLNGTDSRDLLYIACQVNIAVYCVRYEFLFSLSDHSDRVHTPLITKQMIHIKCIKETFGFVCCDNLGVPAINT